MKKIEHPKWFFMWSKSKHIWTKKDVVKEVERQNRQPWKDTCARGGRVVKVKPLIESTQQPTDKAGLSAQAGGS